MYLQRPLIITNCTYMQQIVEATDCGAVVPYGDHEAFASCLIELYKNPARRESRWPQTVTRLYWNVTIGTTPCVLWYRCIAIMADKSGFKSVT